MIGRALLALSLFAGFYLVGLALVAALLWLPWAQMSYSGSMDVSGILAFAGAIYIVWALVPPRTRWAPPGPELSAASEPRLHALIAQVADKTRHAMPHAVYLVTDPGAFASSRPRWYGLRRDPIVGIGLPLLALLTEDELAAVVAHEFGHHVGGDVKLGPWQHRTYAAIGAALHRLDGSNVFLHLPFYAYGRLFLRVTGTASREQELRADALAARTVTPQAIAGALVALERRAAAWWSYWHGVFVPAVNAGFRPPILDGFRRFLAATSDGTEPQVPVAAPPTADDTHPPLEVRLGALGVTVEQSRVAGKLSLRLLDDLPGTELRALVPLLTGPDVIGRLATVSWEEWGTRILPAIWTNLTAERREALAGVPLAALPSLLTSERTWWERLRSGVNVYSPEARRRQLRIWLGQWLCSSMAGAGFAVVSGPGAETALERDGLRVEPFRWVEDLSSGARKPAEWEALAARIAPGPPSA